MCSLYLYYRNTKMKQNKKYMKYTTNSSCMYTIALLLNLHIPYEILATNTFCFLVYTLFTTQKRAVCSDNFGIINYSIELYCSCRL